MINIYQNPWRIDCTRRRGRLICSTMGQYNYIRGQHMLAGSPIQRVAYARMPSDRSVRYVTRRRINRSAP